MQSQIVTLYVSDVVSSVFVKDICAGSNETLTCENSLNSKFTIIINEALSGIKSEESRSCVFKYVAFFIMNGLY